MSVYRNILPITLLVLVGACAKPQTLVCDRDGQEWNKYNTPEDTCTVKKHYPTAPIYIDDGNPTTHPIPRTPSDDPRPPSHPPNQPEPPTSRPEPPSVDPTPPKTKGPQGNNGWGNGDQAAPGNSGSHNNAENNTAGKSDPTSKSKGKKK